MSCTSTRSDFTRRFSFCTSVCRINLLTFLTDICPVYSSVWRSAQLHGDQCRFDERQTSMGSSGETTSQRRDRPVRAAVPRPPQPGRRLADQHHRYVHRGRRTRTQHRLPVPHPRLHERRCRTVEQSAAVSHHQHAACVLFFYTFLPRNNNFVVSCHSVRTLNRHLRRLAERLCTPFKDSRSPLNVSVWY